MSAIINHSSRTKACAPSRYPFGMDKDKYERKQAKRSGFATVEEFRKYVAVEPCDCGEPKCKGWQTRWKFGARRRREGNG